MSRVVFEIDDVDEFTPDARIFAAKLSEHMGQGPGEPIAGELFPDEEPGTLIAGVTLNDPEASLSMAELGVHFSGNRVRGDRLHNQLYSLPESPSPWALDATGDVEELARRSADWFTEMLRRPVVLYVWLHRGNAYAARYLFADRNETLCQSYSKQRAPFRQEKRLKKDGHVHGMGWIQTTGLPGPTLYVHIRGDLELADLPRGVPQATERGPLPRPWYE